MRSRYKVVEAGAYFVTSSIIEWIEIFQDEEYCEIIIDELKFRRRRNEMKLFGYIIMPNHMHLIISSEKLSDVVRSIKSYTARKIIDQLKDRKSELLLKKFEICKQEFKIQSKYQIWQEGFHPKLIMNDKEFEQKIEYIHNNPVKNGLINSPDEWKYSSYKNYSGGSALIEIDNFI